jgi:hypothetical protein
MFYSETQVHVEGGTNEALYPVRQDGFDNSSHTPNRTAISATLNPSRSFMSVSRFPPSISWLAAMMAARPVITSAKSAHDRFSVANP